MSSIQRYLVERYPLAVSAPLALMIGTALADPARATPSAALGTAFLTWLVLLVARGVDDLTSLAQDRDAHPERGLSSGAVDARALRASLVLAGALALGLSPAGAPAGTLLAGAGVLGAAFASRRRVPPALWPLVSNGVFLVLGLWAWSAPDRGGPATLPVALALWLGGAAHHFLHTPTGRPGRALALAPALALATACIAACLAAFRLAPAGSDAPAVAAVLALGLTLALASPRLRPAGETAVFYVWGYLLFLVPLALWCLGRAVERIAAVLT